MNENMWQTFQILTLLLISLTAYGQTDSIYLSFDEVKLDKAKRNVFKGAENASVKINYYHTDGYSHKDRYWYEIIIIDSLMILNFQSPDNDDWDYINYQKQMVIDDSLVNSLLSILDSAGVKQKKIGIPLPPASGYTADRLFIETPGLELAGGTVYINIGGEESEEEYNERIRREMELSSTIEGDFNLVFKTIESLFKELDFLLEDMVKK